MNTSTISLWAEVVVPNPREHLLGFVASTAAMDVHLHYVGHSADRTIGELIERGLAVSKLNIEYQSCQQYPSSFGWR